MHNKSKKITVRAQMKKRAMALHRPTSASLERMSARHILMQADVAAARSVFVYVSHGAEVPTHELIKTFLRRGVTVCVPKMIGSGKMIAVRIVSFDQLSQHHHGILAPMSSVAYASHCAIALVPGVAFTSDGARLGRGGGYYDRWLATHPQTQPIGLAWTWQVIDALPQEKHDRWMARIITCPYTDSPQIFPQII